MSGGGQRQDFGNHVPIARKSVPATEYPTPNVGDVIVIEDIPRPKSYRPILPGTPRANDSALFLLGEREFQTNTHEVFIRRAWSSRRRGEDAFNASLRYVDKVNPTYPVFIREYHILRSDYAPLTELTALQSVVSIAVTAGGAGYTPDGQLALTITGTGAGATAVCEVRGGVIVAAAITHGGDSYTADPSVTVTTPGGGAGATFSAKIQPQTALLTEQEAVPAENIRLPHLDGQNANVAQAALFLKVTRVWTTLPGPILTHKAYDALTGTVITETHQLLAATAADYTLTDALADYRDVPESTATKMRIVREYPAGIFGTTITEYKRERYVYPALLTQAAEALEGVRTLRGQKYFFYNPNIEAERPRTVPHKLVTTFQTTVPTAAETAPAGGAFIGINFGIQQINPVRPSGTGPLFNVGHGPCLTDAHTITATTGSGDPVWGAGIVQSYTFPASVPTAAAYIASRTAKEWFILDRESKKIAHSLYMITTISVPYL